MELNYHLPKDKACPSLNLFFGLKNVKEQLIAWQNNIVHLNFITAFGVALCSLNHNLALCRQLFQRLCNQTLIGESLIAILIRKILETNSVSMAVSDETRKVRH